MSNLPDLYLDIALDGVILRHRRVHGGAIAALEGADPAQGVAAREGGSGPDLALARTSRDRPVVGMGGGPITGSQQALYWLELARGSIFQAYSEEQKY